MHQPDCMEVAVNAVMYWQTSFQPANIMNIMVIGHQSFTGL